MKLMMHLAAEDLLAEDPNYGDARAIQSFAVP